MTDGRLLAFGRGDNIDGRMPQSVSANLGKTWTYSAEPRGYLSIWQTADGVIHLITSKQHYAFNLAWLDKNQVEKSKSR